MLSLLINVLLLGICIYLYQYTKRDSSTKLLNKAQFNKDVKKLRRKTDVVIILDVDKFKRINDTMGHAYGDQVINHISDVIRANIRHSDRAYRIGGDEFAIITTSTSLVSRLKFNVPVSIGVGSCYESADRDMYSEKVSYKGVF